MVVSRWESPYIPLRYDPAKLGHPLLTNRQLSVYCWSPSDAAVPNSGQEREADGDTLPRLDPNPKADDAFDDLPSAWPSSCSLFPSECDPECCPGPNGTGFGISRTDRGYVSDGGKSLKM